MENLKINILLIEDNKNHADYITACLNPELYIVKVFNDGKQSFDYLLAPEIFPDVILVDNIP